MGAAIAIVFLLAAASMIVVIVRRFRFNARAGRVRAHRDLSAVPAAPAHQAPGVLRYSEDGIYSLGRPVGIAGGVFVLATAGLVALLATGESETTWLPVVVMFFSGLLVVGTLISSKPGIRVSDDAIVVGQIAYAERHPVPGFSERMGVPHFVATLPFDQIVEVRFLHGADALALRNAIRASAPPRTTADKKRTPSRKHVLGLFYNGGLPDAMYIRIRKDRTVPIPLVMTASGGGSTTTFNTTWSGPEFLIGTRRPLDLQRAVTDAVGAYHLAGGHPISVALGASGGQE
jgi:hypothetical protein